MTEEPVKPAEPGVKPVNPDFFQTLATSLSGGDPAALLTGIGMKPEQVEALKTSMAKDDMRWQKMGAQLDNMAGVIQYLADTIDKQTRIFGNMVQQNLRQTDLIRRTLKGLSGFEIAYEKAESDMKSKIDAEKAAYEKAHPKPVGSSTSAKVTTSPQETKVA